MEIHEILTQFFNRKKKSNPRISTRQMAKQLGISPSQSSMILTGVRTPSLSLLEDLSKFLDIDPETQAGLRKSILEKKNKNFKNEDPFLIEQSSKNEKVDIKRLEAERAEFVLATKEQFVALKSWHYLAILQATFLNGYDGTAEFISRFLGLPLEFTSSCIQELLQAGLMEKDTQTGSFRKASAYNEYQTQERAKLTQWHISNLEDTLGALKCEKENGHIEDRLVTGAIVSCEKAALPAIRGRILDLLKDLTLSLEGGAHDEVCRIGIQFLPLSQNENQ